ncbi:hypothetical protein QEK82_001567 [Stenotrophomonas maltophilia]|uniref:hypothetical protein n=1 Tax=Stenotrophomonas maltophilia group sp. Smal13 TaxID=3377166 RepID=UPI0025529C09|nr:hypothetical protein [Stenotrophomonas maltophilia]EKU9957647.1 hypothetical protein [Stenotrophomonas maltophilia]EKU9984769.1 hypothetical protein [Stenotrophomonas maltophilia]
MTISATDIKMRQSQRLTDNPDGGGRMVQAEIVDGAMNNLFPDIGDEERTTGRSTLRKMFVHVDTPGPDVLKDAIAVLIDPPSDPRVTVTMFATGSYSDVRLDAKNRVESYITRGTESRFILLGDHFIGQMTIQVYTTKDAPSPDINDNLSLLTLAASGRDPGEQYVRVKNVLSRTTRTFTDDQGAFERDVLVIELVNALLLNFYGQEVIRYTATKPASRVYETNVVDATSYHSVKRLTAAGKPGDLSVQIDSPYVPIVPTSTAETAVSDVLAGMGTLSHVPSGPANSLALSFTSAFVAGVAVTRFLGTGMAVGSVKVLVGSIELSDDGTGGLGSAAVTPWSGTVDYQTGAVSLVHSTGAGSTSVSITATPAGTIPMQGFTDEIVVTQNNQGMVWLAQLVPLPAPGTAVVDYRALGRWYRLTDNGRGQLVGKPGQGSGTINYMTGSLVLTTGALPDLDSSIISAWGTSIIAEARAGDTNIKPPALRFMLGNAGAAPGTVRLTVRVGGADVNVVDNGVGGLLIAGQLRGSVAYATGECLLQLDTLPDANSQVAVNYDWGEPLNAAPQPVPDGNGLVSFTLPQGPVKPGSVMLDWVVTVMRDAYDLASAPQPMRVIAKDDGNGNLVAVSVGDAAATTALGAINYSTGAVSLQAGKFMVRQVSYPQYELRSGRLRVVGYGRVDVLAQFSAGTLVSVGWTLAGADTELAEESLPLPPVSLQLTPTISDSIVPGSVRFSFRGRTYVDRSGGLYHTVDPLTGAGVYAGTIDYTAGVVSLTQWLAGGANGVQIQSLLTRIGDPGVANSFFRAPGSPLRPGMFTLRANRLDGEMLTATADINGVISGAQIRGTVDWESGVAKVQFGQLVPVAGNEGQPWFDPDLVEGDRIWRPALVLAGSIYMGAVVYRSIPLSEVVIGLSSVRLPSDGRAPAFKPGQTVLIHHTAKHSIASPQAGQVVVFGRTRVAGVEVRDAVGKPIESAWYTVDMDEGRLTFSDPLNLAAYALPIVISERVEDRRLVVQPQITGEIEINTGLTHDYPLGEAMISTALRLGEANGSLDLQARVESLFDQGTWTGVWSNVPIGSAAPGTYNDTDFPLEVANSDAITERWAVRFTSATNYEVIGETVGVITTGSTTTDLAPLNPRTNRPYFRMRAGGWGAGWSTNNVVRFNTVGGLAPVWMVRTTLPGTPAGATDSTRLMVVGNVAGGI